ncbi:MAG: hypothetical protein CMJ18_00800 [Phycisphaeraceae bacterium]|nr:hypothetical protein [Phycisphaeraceae bacterium]
MNGQPTPEHTSGPGSSDQAGESGPPQNPASPNQAAPNADPADGALVGVNLEPALLRACDGRLSELTWFRTGWQRGGALTGYASYQADDGAATPVVVKLPVPPVERGWLVRLGAYEDVVPAVLAHGDALNGYDMAWVVMERLAHGPLGPAWQGAEFDLLVEAVGRFYAAAANFPVTDPRPQRDWVEVLQHCRRHVSATASEHQSRWNRALRQAQKKMPKWLDAWHARATDQWCHGDLHLGNAMARQPAPQGPALLFDFALTHPGHWLEDAIYFEHLYWSQRARLGDRRLCRQIAHERRRLGLGVEKDWSELARVRRALVAISVPLAVEAGDRPSDAALEVLEREVG